MSGANGNRVVLVRALVHAEPQESFAVCALEEVLAHGVGNFFRTESLAVTPYPHELFHGERAVLVGHEIVGG